MRSIKGQLSIVLIIFGYTILDIALPARAGEFYLLDTYISPDNIWYGSMTIYGPYMAIGDASEDGVGIDIFDISDPSNLNWIHKIQTNHISYYINWSGNYLYEPSGFNGIFIYDVTDIANPVLAHSGMGSNPVAFADVAIRDNFAIFGGDDGMLIYDISIRIIPPLNLNQASWDFIISYLETLLHAYIAGLLMWQFLIFHNRILLSRSRGLIIHSFAAWT